MPHELELRKPQLRPYQIDIIGRTDAAIAAGRRRLLLRMPTGSGKTVVASDIISKEIERGKRVLFLAHRGELIQQASRKLYDVGVDHGIIKAGFPTRPGEPVQVASIQTLHARAVSSIRMELPDADQVVVDEAHHCPAKTYRNIIAAYPNAIILGLTATPCRGDGRGLGKDFEVLIEAPPVAELISEGYLVGTKVYAPTLPDLTGVRVRAGDYVEEQLAERMDRPQLVGDIVTNWLRLGEGRPTVVFASGVEHSVHLRDQFRAAGVLAEHIDGSTPIEERGRILAQLAAGVVEVVCNAMVLTEGWDSPGVSCIVLARPTKHMGLYHQMVGRGLRPAPDKVNALVLDHAGAIFQHGFVEDPVIWTLDPDRRAINPKHVARAKGEAPQLGTCPECHAVIWRGRQCGACGWRPQTKPKAVEVADGELGQVDRQRKVQPQTWATDEKRRFFAELLWICDNRRYNRGTAAHKFREKFGDWPPPAWRSVEPTEPAASTRSWFRSRMIAYAKARQRSDA